MPTSIHNGLVTFDPSLYGVAETPMDATTMRDGVANGLLHIADSAGQVRVNYLARPEEHLSLIAEDDTGPWNGTYRRFHGGPFGPWPLTLHQNAAGYFLRIRLAVSSSGDLDHTSQPVRQYVRIVIAPLSDLSGLDPTDTPVDWHVKAEWYSDQIPVSPEWLPVQSQGTLGLEHVAYVSQEQVSAWLRSVPIYNGLSGSQPMTVNQVLVAAHVFGATDDVRWSSSVIVPRIHALHISEFCG